MNRAFIFTMDAIMALVPVFIIVGAVSTMSAGESILLRGHFVGLHYAASDLAAASEKSGYIDDMGEMFTNYTDLKNKGDPLWTIEKERLLNYTNDTLLRLVSENRGFAVEFWGVYENGTSYLDVEYTTDNRTVTGQTERPYENESATTLASVKLATGYEKDVPLVGYTARGWIDKVEKKKVDYVYFADTVYDTAKVGTGCTPSDWINISYNINLSVDSKANISNVTWYLAPIGTSAEVRAYLNGNLVYSTGNIGGLYVVQNATLYDYIQPGDNNFTMETYWDIGVFCWGSGDKTSRVVITYYTDEISEGYPTRFPLETVYSPGYIGDYEKAVFVPNTDVQSLSVTLNAYGNDVALGFLYEDLIITIDDTQNLGGGWGTLTWSDSDIRPVLQANGISYANLTDKYFKFLFNIEPSSGEAEINGANSYVDVTTSSSVIPYGYIQFNGIPTLNSYINPQWNGFYKNVDYEYFLGQNVTPYYTRFHILWTWDENICSQSVTANTATIHQSPPSPFIENVDFVGYTPTSYSGSMITGTNDFSLSFGDCYGVHPFGTLGEYTYLVPSMVPFGEVFDYPGAGFNISVYYDADQNGTWDGSQTIMVGGGGPELNFCSPNELEPDDEALHDAFLRLMDKLNFVDDTNPDGYGSVCADYDGNEDNPIDLAIEPDVQIESQGIGDVPFMWGPVRVRFRVWE